MREILLHILALKSRLRKDVMHNMDISRLLETCTALCDKKKKNECTMQEQKNRSKGKGKDVGKEKRKVCTAHQRRKGPGKNRGERMIRKKVCAAHEKKKGECACMRIGYGNATRRRYRNAQGMTKKRVQKKEK